MRIRLFFLLSAIFLINCTHKQEHNPIIHEKTTLKKNIPLADFTQVNIAGNINVDLHTGYKHSEVLLLGDARDLKNVKVRVKGYVLTITMIKPPLYGAVKADILGHELTAFNYKGSGIINGDKIQSNQLNLNLNNRGSTTLAGDIRLYNLTVKGSGLTNIHGIKSNQLTIHLTGKPKVQLSGMVNVSNVMMNGSGWLDLSWVKSNRLTLRAHGAAQMQLAGIVNTLDVELWGKAQFKGRYLRAKTTFVKTHGHSRAEITTLNRQHTLALDASDIYFYKIAKFDSNFMGDNGAVLDLGIPREF
jgi:hypothetical protein